MTSEIQRKKTKNKTVKKYIFISIYLFISFPAFSQIDTVQVLTFESFMEIVREHHPVARQADLQIVKGEGKLMKARGSFDPKLYNNLGQKYFEGKEYFSLLDAGLKVPTWFGVELKAGLEQNRGIYLDPENNTPSSGLWYAGISLPVGTRTIYR